MREREYKKLVLEAFDSRWKAHDLPQELIAPTRKDLKELSIATCILRYEVKDEPILGSFFGTKEHKAAYQIAIQNCSAEDFRTLNNFLNDRSIEPSLKNINLLAWLMDFKPRPFHPDLKMPDDADRPNPVKPEKPIGQKPSKRNYMQIIAFALLSAVIIIAVYFMIQGPSDKGPQGCMYWNMDHYQPISCNKKPADTMLTVIALDKVKLQHFKKITRPDTLTAASIGKAWYAKVNGDVEYYTSGGQHPLYPGHRLLPLTATILNNHYNSRVR